MKKAYTIVMRLGKKFEGKSFCSTLSIAFYRMGHIWSIVLKGLKAHFDQYFLPIFLANISPYYGARCIVNNISVHDRLGLDHLGALHINRGLDKSS